tara:strand:+ start:548 stop:739 length:192 start_codon:yes stop_codon:yes gene_type:complete
MTNLRKSSSSKTTYSNLYIEYKNYWITTGQRENYLIWTENYKDLISDNPTSIKRAKEYIDKII